MKLWPITIEEVDRAVALLKEGFGELKNTTWHASLLSIFQYAKTIGETNIGSIIFNKDGDIGICLAIPSVHFIYENEPKKVINLAALYLKQQQQWMAPAVLRRMMSNPNAEYIDLTPSHSMRKINELLGFTTRTVGIVLVTLSVSAFRHSAKTHILPYNDKTALHLPETLQSVLHWHVDQGCICLIVKHKDEYFPLILKRKMRSGLPSSRVLLAPSRAFLRDIMGPLARYLISKGVFFTEFDGTDKARLWEVFIRRSSPCIQSTQIDDTESLDHTFSELVFVL